MSSKLIQCSNFESSSHLSSVIISENQNEIRSTPENTENIRNASEDYSCIANANVTTNNAQNRDNAQLQDCNYNEIHPDNAHFQDCNEIQVNNFNCDLALSDEDNVTSFSVTNHDERNFTNVLHPHEKHVTLTDLLRSTEKLRIFLWQNYGEDFSTPYEKPVTLTDLLNSNQKLHQFLQQNNDVALLPPHEKLVTSADLLNSTEILQRSQLPTYLSLSKKFLSDEPPRYEFVTGKQLNHDQDLPTFVSPPRYPTTATTNAPSLQIVQSDLRQMSRNVRQSASLQTGCCSNIQRRWKECYFTPYIIIVVWVSISLVIVLTIIYSQ